MSSPTIPTASRTQLEFLREACGWTRRELAERSGVSVPTILALERRNRPPTLATVEKLSNAFGVRVGDLFPRDE
jgi:transcriptional regulator with XRE-family HTH domain